ncbi:uncharacterized protein NDAI_0E01870 [Naumovozyma dairenensis CBS 421]|uniref:RING-type domain-containing protein n=1 Tax=Naumovozyma dairenensis (strain ATCC 10597 / BCRC 20456 / CBS 421 / NBRC 0211 / NRRL Y-12639) TaxID=1071378 RepID=G0WB83_NAUDC|nr:hypothetical protein NDAI_0E01870 [Naumovozyma dairenensis CBS 421]CCD25003.1 hypothetical protein NDAI_0E01870 [Naumovozyma dairenensis CBS 421]
MLYNSTFFSYFRLWNTTQYASYSLSGSKYLNISDTTNIAKIVNMARMTNVTNVTNLAHMANITNKVDTTNVTIKLIDKNPPFPSSSEFFAWFMLYVLPHMIVINAVIDRLKNIPVMKSNIKQINLPAWSRISLHLLALVPLTCGISVFYMRSCILQVYESLFGASFESFFGGLYYILCLSHGVEVFYSSTTNSSQLLTPNFGVSQLGFEFYSLWAMAKYEKYTPETSFLIRTDCTLLLVNRLIIHLVEVLNMRKKYSIFSTTVYLVYLPFFLKNFNSLPFALKAREINKLLSVVMIFTSFIFHSFRYITNKDKNSIFKYMHMFKLLNLTGEENIELTLFKFATFLCDGNDIDEFPRQDPEIHSPLQEHSYIISGYLNEVNSNPEDYDTIIPDVESSIFSSPTAMLVMLISLCCSVIISRTNLMIYGSTLEMKKRRAEGKRRTHSKHYDLNNLITDNNYAMFMTRVLKTDKLCVHDPDKYLLPDTDTSPDYNPPINDPRSEDEDGVDSAKEEEILSESIEEESRIFDLLVPVDDSFEAPDLNWYLSMWSIMKYTFQYDKRLTRTSYWELANKTILNEIIHERRTQSTKEPSQDEDLFSFSDDDDDEEELDLTCVLCKRHRRRIVLWPCNCLTICDECRLAIGRRGTTKCICCAEPVKGYSKLNVV